MSVSLANLAASPTNPVTGAPHSSPGSCGGVLSPHKIKVEPKFLQNPCTGATIAGTNLIVGNGGADHWMSSPSPQLHSPPAMSPTAFGHVNGQLPGHHAAGVLPTSHVISNGFSPLSCSSYETFSPNGEYLTLRPLILTQCIARLLPPQPSTWLPLIYRPSRAILICLNYTFNFEKYSLLIN